SAPVSRPTAGSTTIAPRARRVSTLARVAGGSHISVCMAGAYTMGHRAGSSTVVRRGAGGGPGGGVGERRGGGRRHHDEVGAAAEPHVRHLVGVGPDIGCDRPPG